MLRLMGKDFLNTGARARPVWIAHEAPPERRRYYRLF